MASVAPSVPGSGTKIPVTSYMAGITESYPNVNRKRLVEASINSKDRIDFFPSNMGLNHVITDKYIEFRISGTTGSFLDLSNIVLELKLQVERGGAALQNDVHIGLANGISNTLFKSVNIFLNDKMVESNPFYNYCSYIKMLKSFKPTGLDNLGRCGFLHDDHIGTGIKDMFVTASFTDEKSLEKVLSDTVKNQGVHICFPLLLDISSLDMYLLDGVGLRIRLELANNSWVMNSNDNTANSLKIAMAKLWMDRVTPHHSAMLALNESLRRSSVQYIFNKTLHKTYVIGQNESSIMIDQPFGNCIPDRMSLVMIDMNSFSGDYTRNGLYFRHCNLSNIHITINGSTIYNINCKFPNEIAQAYYETQKAIGLERDHMITYESFKQGRSVFYFNFVSEDMQDALPVELSASMRLNLSFNSRLLSPTVIILFAETIGLLSIDGNRSVVCDVRG